jgi:hypothetical protein
MNPYDFSLKAMIFEDRRDIASANTLEIGVDLSGQRVPYWPLQAARSSLFECVSDTSFT